MAHTRKSKTSFEAREKRLALKVAGKPYYEKLEPGLSLGYRRNRNDGAWVVRLSDGKGGNHIERLGVADDYEPVPAGALNYWQAREAAIARRRGGKVPAGTVTKPITVSEALEEYALDLERRGDTRILKRLRVILKPLENVRVIDLTSGTLLKWQGELKGRNGTINRQCASIRAALTFAADRHDIDPTARPWIKGLPLVHRDEPKRDRNVVLAEGVVREIVAEAYRRSYEFGLLVDLSAVTGARYSQLAACQVQDLIKTRLTVWPSKKGKPGKRAVAQALEIGAGLADRLRVAAAGKPATAPLLTKPNGEPWRASDHFQRFREVVKAVGQDPAEVSIYALRHTHITRQLLALYPTLKVAQWHDTSDHEIATRYGLHLSSHGDQPPAPDYGIVVDDKVVALRSGEHR